MFGYLRLEMLRLTRDIGFLLVSLFVPIGMYLLFASIGGAQGPTEKVYHMVGLAAFGAVNAVMSAGTAVAEDRSLGWLRQLRLTPLSTMNVIFARGLCALMLAALPISGVFLLGGLVKGVPLSSMRWAELSVLLLIGVIPMTLFSLGVGYLFTAQKAQLAGLVGALGLSAISGLWVPITFFPSWLQEIAKFTPVYQYAQISWSVGYGGIPDVITIVVLLAWGALFAAFAIFGYQRGGRHA